MATSVTMQRASNDRPWLIGLGVLVVIGIIAWIVQLAVGFDVLGVGQSVSWGAYIATFFLLAGAGSGLVVLAATGDLNVFPELKEYRTELLTGALACYVAAGFAVMMDVGKPWRALAFLYSPNFKSMFVWDFYFLAISVILTVIYLLRSQTRNVALLAGAASTILMIVEGWILTVTAGTALWHNSIIPVVFLIEGLMTAMALVLLLRGVAGGAGQVVRRGLLLLLPIIFVLSFVEMVAVLYGADVEAATAMMVMVGGSVAPFYWLALILGVAVPFGLLGWGGTTATTIRAASILTIAGVFAAKLNLLVAGRSVPFMHPEATYGPSIVEFGGVIGALGLAALLFLLGLKYLPGFKKA